MNLHVCMADCVKGISSVCVCVCVCVCVTEEGVLRTLMTGRGVALGSQFRLTWSMITNMLRVEDLKVRTHTHTHTHMRLPDSCTQKVG